MSRVIGLACDNCGKLDVEVNYEFGVNEDSFPRDGWVSLIQWGDAGDPGPATDDIHICSIQCLRDFVSKIEDVPEEDHGHTHD